MSEEVETLIAELSKAQAYPHLEVAQVVVHQTHISVVFLAADRAYKLKKPVDLGFVDYSTLERRREFCEAEVALNRRLAPDVYIGIRPIVEGEGGLCVGEDADAAVEWAVEMVRLDEDAHLKAHLHESTLQPEWMQQLGEKMARFHTAAEGGPEIAQMASYESVAGNALDNFSQSRDQVGETVSARVFDALKRRTTEELERLRPLIERRRRRGEPCDTHGDLRLEHVYRIDDDLVVVDCIEFNDAFRYADPVADIAFLVMDLRFRWETDLADRFVDAYFDHRDDPDGAAMLDFYVAYRSAVRAKVHGIAACDEELPPEDRDRARQHSRAHWNFAWSTLAEPASRPMMLMLAGLPGTGKSTLARHLAAEHDFVLIDSDVVRKRLAGVEGDAAADLEEGIYTPEWTARTYQQCLEESLHHVDEGRRVAVEATFRCEHHRDQFLEQARAHGTEAWIVECTLPRDVALQRLDERSGADSDSVSDADRGVYLHVESNWEAPGDLAGRRWTSISNVSSDQARRQVDDFLAQHGRAKTVHS